MLDLGRALIAGFVATVVISMLMIMRLSAGIMPWFHPVEIMNLTVQELFGAPGSALLGWATHFAVGTILWGGLFRLVEPRLPGGSYTRRGLVFGTLAWLVVMITLFPLAGSGLFGLGFGLIVPITTLITHWIFGAVLGASYGWLKSL